ncbi:ParB/RepB/Spo0J family partition protein [Peptoniphilus sp.]|jgi:ParB family chromosome partitioning protein|uniref:ParB/RepB/Spo0J family partition protein n=1 Tax=Peptoniphilus sp. TaxID=1971214 RepID=UPI003D91941A
MTKKTGLGRGIGNFLASSEQIREVIEDENSKLKEIEIEKIVPNVDQPRKMFDEEEITELSKSIKKYGIIQPLLVRDEGDKYIIIAGERRFRAAQKAGLKKVPAIIKDISTDVSDRISIIENIQRKDLNPVEEAMSYKHILDSQNLTQKELAEEIGKSRQYIGNTIRLLNLDPRVLKLLEKGEISPSHGKNLLSIKDKDEQYKKAMKIVKDTLPVNDNKKKPSPKEKKLDIFKEKVRDDLTSKLGTKVMFKEQGKKGKIEIEYYSEEDLSRIVEIILEGN